MKRIQTTIVILILNAFSIFPQEIQYIAPKGVHYQNGNCEVFTVKDDTFISLKKYDRSSYYYISPIDFSYENFKFVIGDNVGRYFNSDIELKNSIKIVDSNVKVLKIIPSYYQEVLKKQDARIIFENQPEWSFFEKNYATFEGETFYESFGPESISISNLFVYFTMHNYYLIESISYEDNTYAIKLYRSPYDGMGDDAFFDYEQPYPDNYMNHKNDNEITLLLEFDGDYIDIWINSKNEYMGKYFIATKETFYEINNLVSNRTVNFSNIYWPRHADGTSDFDKKVIPPMVKLVNSERQEVIKKSPSSTNVSPNKTMLVRENLKLRSGEATSTQVLTVMSAGTKVKILELGKAEKIDGINSNWVKVEVQKNAKDRDGKAIKAGTIGWCYGGYLE